MRILVIATFLLINSVFSQNVELKLLDSIPLKAERFIGVDNFDYYYYQNGNTLYKKSDKKTYSYTNTQLGNISSVDITNPLKIIVFYKGFNTVVLLDSQLNEYTDVINFNAENFAKNVNFVGLSSSNNLWLYSNDDQTLSLWDYEADKLIFESQPLSFFNKDFKALRLFSNYKYCWLFSDTMGLQFNEFGSFVEEIKIENPTFFKVVGNEYLWVKNNILYYKDNDTKGFIKKLTEPQESSSFFLFNNIFFHFKTNTLYRFQVLKK